MPRSRYTRKIIALQPIGNNIPTNTLNILKHNIENQYNCSVTDIAHPSPYLIAFINYEKGKRYAASAVIRHLKETMPGYRAIYSGHYK